MIYLSRILHAGYISTDTSFTQYVAFSGKYDRDKTPIHGRVSGGLIKPQKLHIKAYPIPFVLILENP